MQAVEQVTPKAVLYARVSSEQQADEGTSLETQIEECQKKAQGIGCEVVGEFIDAGVSGDFYKQRPELQRALRMIEAGKADTFIVLNVDRFSRNTEHQQSIKARIEKAGGRLVFCQIDFEQNAEGDLMYGVVGNLARYERKKILQRTAGGMVARARSGIQPVRSISPLGYRIVRSQDVMAHHYTEDLLGTYQLIEEEAKLVKRIFDMVNAGESLRGVCRVLQQEGVPTPKGGAYWRPDAIRFTIRHSAYKGEAYYNKSRKIRSEDFLDNGQKNPFVMRPNTPENVICIPCPAIVTREEWESANQRLREARELYGGRKDRKHMLTGLLRCATCNRGMRAMTTRGKYSYYLCQYANDSLKCAGHNCSRIFLEGTRAESLVTKGIIEAMKHPEIIEAAVASWMQKQEDTFDQGEYDRLKMELRNVESKLKAVAVAQVQAIQDGADPAVFRAMVSECSQRKREISKQIAVMDSQRDEDRVEPAQVSKIIESTLQDVARVLESTRRSDVEKHDILAKIVKTIRPAGDGLNITLIPVQTGSEAQSVGYVSP